jgi:hypothetical protein
VALSARSAEKPVVPDLPSSWRIYGGSGGSHSGKTLLPSLMPIAARPCARGPRPPASRDNRGRRPDRTGSEVKARPSTKRRRRDVLRSAPTETQTDAAIRASRSRRIRSASFTQRARAAPPRRPALHMPSSTCS